jgi:tetratricopeptide (TPR) repeat protein
MSDIKHREHSEREISPIDKWKHFQDSYGKTFAIVLGLILIVVLGFFAYKQFFIDPKEKLATEAMFRAEDYYRADSIRLALNGDAVNAGFAKIVSRYSGTKAANLASFYAGSCYLKLGDFNNAVKYLKDFKTSAIQVQAKAYGLLGDAYSELNQKDQAVEEYKKAGTLFEQDEVISPEYLFRAGYLLESMGKSQDAITMYELIKSKYPSSPRGFDIDRYLARLGVVK